LCPHCSLFGCGIGDRGAAVLAAALDKAAPRPTLLPLSQPWMLSGAAASQLAALCCAALRCAVLSVVRICCCTRALLLC
jgi:hypothetical protein